jgi:hypothetical protein
MSGGRFRRVGDSPAYFYRQRPASLWRRSVAQLEPVKRLHCRLRQVEAHLRAQSPDGAIEARAADALTQYYVELAEFVEDPDTLIAIAESIRAVGRSYSPRLSRKMRLVAKTIGWENAERIKAFYRRRVLAAPPRVW